jgi:hypothetical protein
MKALLTTFMLLFTVPTNVIGQDGKGGAEKFLVRITDSQFFSYPTAGPVNMRNCMVVVSDGRIQLELFRQEFSSNGAVKVYQGKLDESDLETLSALLDQPSLMDLPDFVPPNIPMVANEGSVFIADISREGSMQTVGFFGWKGDGPTNSDGQKQRWQNARLALQPLVQWSRTVKIASSLAHWRPAPHTPASCLVAREQQGF